MMSETRLLLRVIDDAADPQDVDEATSRLREELLELDVVVSAAEAGQAPEGSRAVLSFALGGLVIGLASTDLIAAIVNAVTAWLTRNQHRSVKLDIEGDVLELTGISSEEQRRLTEVWLRRRQGGTAVAASRRTALIVANDQYRDPGLRRLRAPALDAEALARVLGDEAIGGFDVRTMLNESTSDINEAVEEFFADRQPGDLLLLHFSSHGVKDDSGELYFATPSTKLNRLGATAVSAEFVNRRMNRSRCRRIILLLDCCYAGAFARGALPRAGANIHVEEQFGGRGRVVITASNAMQYAFEGPELADTRDTSPSVFTSALVEGLETGEADRDQDGYVGIQELYDYVYDRVRAVTPNQTPGKWTFDVQGDLVIARRGRPVNRPAPLPPELQEAIDHPIAKIRAGAVEELARLRHSKHEGLALAARMELEQLVHDDSRIVSSAAHTALAPATAPPSPGTANAPSTPAAPSTPSVPSPPAAPEAVAPEAPAVVPEASPAVPKAAAPVPVPDRGVPPAAEPADDPVTDVPALATSRGRGVVGLVSRGLALLAALLLVANPMQVEPGLRRFGELNEGTYPIWYLALAAAALAVALVREGRTRAALLGAAAALAALNLSVAAHIADYSDFSTVDLMNVAGALLILLAVLLETALARTGAVRIGAIVAGLLAVVMTVISLANPDLMSSRSDALYLVLSAIVIFAAALPIRAGFDRQAGRPWPEITFGVAAPLLVAAAVLTVYDNSSGEVLLPVLLIVLVVSAQATRPETLLALHLTAIIGLLHNLAFIETSLVYAGILLAATVCAVAAAYLSGVLTRER